MFTLSGTNIILGLQFNIICKGDDYWAVVRKEYKLDDTFTSERFEGIDNLYNYLRELITDLVVDFKLHVYEEVQEKVRKIIN